MSHLRKTSLIRKCSSRGRENFHSSTKVKKNHFEHLFSHVVKNTYKLH